MIIVHDTKHNRTVTMKTLTKQERFIRDDFNRRMAHRDAKIAEQRATAAQGAVSVIVPTATPPAASNAPERKDGASGEVSETRATLPELPNASAETAAVEGTAEAAAENAPRKRRGKGKRKGKGEDQGGTPSLLDGMELGETK